MVRGSLKVLLGLEASLVRRGYRDRVEGSGGTPGVEPGSSSGREGEDTGDDGTSNPFA